MKLLFFVILFFLTTVAASETKALRIGIYDNPPKIFLDKNSKPSGFFVDVLNEIAHKENWHLEYVACEWEECLLMLENGKLEIMPDVAYSKEREKHFKFNREVALSNWSVIFANKKSKILSIVDLQNKKLVLLRNSIQHEQLQQIFNLFDVKPIYMYAKNYEEAFSLVQNNDADAVITNRHFGERKRDTQEILKTSILLNPSVLKFAFSRSDDNNHLIQRVDYHLKELKENKNSIYYKSHQKWLNTEEHFHHIPTWVYITLFVVFIALLLFVLTTFFFKYLLSIKIKEANTQLQKNEQLQKQKTEDYKKTLMALISMVEQRDSYTAGHSQRVANYSKLIAKEMGYGEVECELLYEASILHDIGKIATPDAVLLKPDKLTKLEYDLIKEHVNVAKAILKDIPMFEEILSIISYHHEKYDGSGYPEGVAKNEIPPLARVMMVADAFDAMTTNRIYKHKKSVKEALEEIESFSGSHYHPEVVQGAIRALRNIELLQEHNQTPTTALEEQRFVYFYKDAITNLYNVKYLEAVLVNHINGSQKYKKIMIISLHKFDLYNKKHGWEQGDKKLQEFAHLLCDFFEESLLFRVRANDFVALFQNEPIKIDALQKKIENFIKSAELEFDFNIYDLKDDDINSYEDLKKFL